MLHRSLPAGAARLSATACQPPHVRPQLPPPVLPLPTAPHRARPAPAGFGAWNLRDVRFLTGSQLASWGIACFANPRFAQPDLCQMQGQHGPSFIKARVCTWFYGCVQGRAGLLPPR